MKTVFPVLQCLLLKCRLQHSNWRWQQLIVQVPATNRKQYPCCTAALQLSKIATKNNHVPYNMRCWKCCHHSSAYFCHLFRKCAFTWINSISEIQSISCLIPAYNSSKMWVFIAYILFFKCPIDKNRKSPHIRRIKNIYQA